MKRIFAVVAVLVVLSANCFAEMLPALPAPFDGIDTNHFDRGIVPVAVYLVVDYNKARMASFECVGTMFWADKDTCNVILPKHLFTKSRKYDGAFFIRPARPDTRDFIGCVTKVETLREDYHGRDVACAMMSTNWTSITNFNLGCDTDESENIIYSASPSVTIRGKEIKTLRSLITQKQVTILGYALRPSGNFYKLGKPGEEKFLYKKVPTDVDSNPYIVVDASSGLGYDGSAFFDEHQRMFIMHSGAIDNNSGSFSNFSPEAASDLKRIFGKVPEKGVVFLTGPIHLELK